MKYCCEKTGKTSKHFDHWADAIGGFACEFCGKEVETEYEEDCNGNCWLWTLDEYHTLD